MKNLREYGFNTDNKVFVVAEIGINHGGNIEMAHKLIASAMRTGVDAVKFQTYVTEKRASKDSPIYSILKKCELPFEAFKELKNYTEQQGAMFFSTPFDEDSIEYLESINCPIYKIASFDVVNLKLLKKIANSQKPIIMSVGMSNLDEIKNAYNILKSYTYKITLLHCITSYPAKSEDSNLAVIYILKNEFADCVIGHSDHTNDIVDPSYAVVAGAQVIEKHFMLDDKSECIDKSVSITEKQMIALVSGIRKIEQILGDEELGITEAQKDFTWLRRYST